MKHIRISIAIIMLMVAFISTYQCNKNPAQPKNKPPVLRIINDLFNQTVASGIPWGKINSIVSVRIGPSKNDVLTNPNYECLEPLETAESSDFSCCVDIIFPEYNTTTFYEDFDVSNNKPDYYVYIAIGYWELRNIDSFLWDKIYLDVLCSDGRSICPKEVVIHITGHNSGLRTIRASDYLPHGHWDGSL